MAAWPGCVDAAVVHDHHGAIEFLGDYIGRGEIAAHVLVLGFGADQAAVERVDEHDAGLSAPSCALMSSIRASASAIRLSRPSPGRTARWRAVVPPERLDAGREAVAPFKGEVDDGGLLHSPAAVIPAQRNVQAEVDGPKALAAFRRSPDDGKPGAGQQAFDQIAAPLRVDSDVFECDEREPRGGVASSRAVRARAGENQNRSAERCRPGRA